MSEELTDGAEVTIEQMRVDVVGVTEFRLPADVPLELDADGPEALAEFAGRACYESWSKPNPATATKAGYLRHVIEVGHLSVLEHAQVTVYIRGISRSLTHELIRHRHFSYSQLSQRHIPEGEYVVPEPVASDRELAAQFVEATAKAHAAYQDLMAQIETKLQQVDSTARRKRARQAAQTLLPGARSTDIVVSGNLRAWRQFIAVHGTDQADDEIRALAVVLLRRLREVAGNAFGDFEISTLPDGREIASSALVTEG